jgi:hypothetical protein
MDQTISLKMPPVVAWLGYGGLVPFVVLAAASVLDPGHSAYWSDALVAYGAVILSFVGALHWGFAMSLADLSNDERRRRFLWSVVPALMAWPAMLLGTSLAALVLVAGFVAHYLHDRHLGASAFLPRWYLPLRFRLTVVACGSLSIAGFLA